MGEEMALGRKLDLLMALAMDDRFHDPGMTRPGVRFTMRAWPPGYTGTAIPHGAVFSR